LTIFPNLLAFATMSMRLMFHSIRSLFAVTFLVAFTPATEGWAISDRTLTDHVPSVVAKLQPIKQLPSTNQMRLVIGLPLRNESELDGLIGALHDPASPQYRQWLTPAEFTHRFGPSEDDYNKVVAFAETNGLQIVGKSSNRVILDVMSTATNIERVFKVTLNEYQHPTEPRTFFAPNVEPSVSTDLPILHISGLDNFVLPYRRGGSIKLQQNVNPHLVASGPGSSSGGYFMGSDFRSAYVPGVTNTGVGQYIAIVDVGGPYYPKDVYMYQTNANLSTNIGLTNIILSGWTGVCVGTNVDEGEEVLDITMAMSMAPGAVILNYEGEAHDVFNQIAVDNKAKQMTLSYGFGIDSTIIQMFKQFLVQGQALCSASGDSGARKDGVTGIDSSPYIVEVAGTSLTTKSANGPWKSEVVWGGSCGGISGYGIPTWQQGMDFTLSAGSSSYRNYPDVAMPADNIFTVYKNGGAIGATGGASASSPLFAGFLALANEEAEAQGKPSVGFPLPAIYAIGKSSYSYYTNCFHDVTSGNNYSSESPSLYAACKGYDLCTGWGSPTGSNTIQAMIGWGTNDFMFQPSQAVFNMLAGGYASATITPAFLNGLTGTVTFSIEGFPDEIITSITSSSDSLYNLSVSVPSNLLPGTYTGNLIGTIGDLKRSIALKINISTPLPGTEKLVTTFNRIGIWSDGTHFSGGFDNGGSAFSANLLGTEISWNGILFNLGSPNIANCTYFNGQTITTTSSGQYPSLILLAAAANGNQTSQNLVIKYTDGSSSTITQNFSDWANPQHYQNEFTASSTGYRNNSDGTSGLLTVNIYAYNIPLDPSKTFSSITLSRNSNVILFALKLATLPEPVTLASFYNRAGMYTDSTAFTNPATGGLDGGGSALSATILGGSLIWSNTLFTFGTPNATNIISATNQVIPLNPGCYSSLRILATAINGNQPSQLFVVSYTNGTTSNFSRSISDWYSPQNYSGESKAVATGYRMNSDGTKDNRTFYLYGYTLPLDITKGVKNIKLPKNANVMIAAISLVPNWQPAFYTTPFTAPSAIAGQAYSATAATNAYDPNNDTIIFSKQSGPSWLSVSSSGILSGQPTSADVGENTFVLNIADLGGLSTSSTMTIEVDPSPFIQLALTSTPTNSLILSWTGGTAPFQVLMSTNLSETNWTQIGETTSERSITLIPTNTAAFYQIRGQ